MPWNKPLPEWNKSAPKPAQFKLDEGWLVEEKPPASIFNWFQYTAYHAIKELQDNGYTKTEADSMAQNTVEAYAEPIITKNTAFNKDFGTSPGTVAEGDVVPRVTAIEDDWSLKERQTANPTHGVSVLNSDIPSSLKVEFYGNTLVNLLGKIGNFETDSDGDGIADGFERIGSGGEFLLSNDGKYGEYQQEIQSTSDESSASRYARRTRSFEAGKYYIVLVDLETDGGKGALKVFYDDTTQEVADSSTNSRILYVKFSPSQTSDSEIIDIRNENDQGVVSSTKFDGLRLYEIDQATYDAIGVSLTDSDVERLFPYVDSVQHVENPVLSVEGENLLPPFYEWDLHDNATVVSPYELELNATSSQSTSRSPKISIVPNQSYAMAFTNNSPNSGANVVEYDKDGNILSQNTSYLSGYQTMQIKTKSNASHFEVLFYNISGNSGTFTLSQPMLNLGSTAKPFVERNPSYLYAEVTLAGNENKKDILYRNEDKNRWEVKREIGIEDDFSNLNWTLDVEKEGFTVVAVDRSEFHNMGGSSHNQPLGNVTVKYDGTPLETLASRGLNADNITKADQTAFGGNGFSLSISDEDATGYDLTTTTGIQTFFSDKNYFLSYQLASPVTENVDHLVEGDLSIQGDAQISVNTGFSYTTDEQGNRMYTLTPESERYKETTNLNDVTVYYNETHGSSSQEEVTKSSDNATKISQNQNKLYSHQANYVDHPAFAVSSGTSTAYTATLNPAPSEYKDGMEIKLAIHTDATGASTLNINGLGAIPLKKSNGNAVDNLKANGVYKFVYYNANFILQGEGGEGTAQPADVLDGETFANDDGVYTGSMTNQGAYNITPDTTNQAIPQGYHDGQGIVSGDPDLVAANIRNGVSLFGVLGKNSVVDTEDGNVNSSQMITGLIGYAGGDKIEGSMNNYNGDTITSNYQKFSDSTIDVEVPNTGYYTVNSKLRIQDANLSPSNIRNGVDIFGVVGTLSIPKIHHETIQLSNDQASIDLGWRPTFIIAWKINTDGYDWYTGVVYVTDDYDYRITSGEFGLNEYGDYLTNSDAQKTYQWEAQINQGGGGTESLTIRNGSSITITSDGFDINDFPGAYDQDSVEFIAVQVP